MGKARPGLWLGLAVFRGFDYQAASAIGGRAKALEAGHTTLANKGARPPLRPW
jgi:hypothetical protein